MSSVETRGSATSRVFWETEGVYESDRRQPVIFEARRDEPMPPTATAGQWPQAKVPELRVSQEAWHLAEALRLPLPSVIAAAAGAFPNSVAIVADEVADLEVDYRFLVVTITADYLDYERFLRGEQFVFEQLGQVPPSALAALTFDFRRV